MTIPCRLADEYDAAQERGEVVGRKGGGDTTVPVRNAATAADVGLSRKQIHEARAVRELSSEGPAVRHCGNCCPFESLND